MLQKVLLSIGRRILQPTSCLPSSSRSLCDCSSTPHDSKPSQKIEDSSKKSSVTSRPASKPIEMLSADLHHRLFGTGKSSSTESEETELTDRLGRVLPDIPTSSKTNAYLNPFLTNIATQQSAPYKHLMDTFAAASLPRMPSNGDWSVQPGWTRYSWKDNVLSRIAVDHPLEDIYVFDVEIVVAESMAPCMATAVSEEAWYSWCSPNLAGVAKSPLPNNQQILPENLISIGSSDHPRLVIGHNVGFDRARIAEMFDEKLDGTRCWDTMAMHISMNGMTGEQLIAYKGKKSKDAAHDDAEQQIRIEADAGSQEAIDSLADIEKMNLKRSKSKTSTWDTRTCPNSLVASHRHHCPESTTVMNKLTRDVFVTGTTDDVRENYQALMTYCATDCLVTHELFVALWKKFDKFFPHPATLSGMLHMSRTYLPVTSAWQQMINTSKATVDKLERDAYNSVKCIADQVRNTHKLTYTTDAWMWSQDWTPRPRRGEKRDTADPAWYRTLISDYQMQIAELVDNAPAPKAKSIRARMTPYLMKLCWSGHPLVHTVDTGWAYITVDREELDLTLDMYSDAQTLTFIMKNAKGAPVVVPVKEIADIITSNASIVAEHSDMVPGMSRSLGVQCVAAYDDGTNDTIEMPKGFVKLVQLPHPTSRDGRVGTPLAQPFIKYITHGVLHSHNAEHSALLDELTASMKAMSYWISSKDRVLQQIVCQPPGQTASINPQLCVTGTITRRAVERLWMTVSNPKVGRIASEIKAMVMAPEGYSIVGADIDSQEQWLAAVLADQYASRNGGKQSEKVLPGKSEFAAILLAGEKSTGTDLHSRVADLLGIKRDHAKVLNYGRLYGAGEPFAKNLLSEFNPTASPAKIDEMAAKLYAETKGKRQPTYRRLRLKPECQKLYEDYLEEHPEKTPAGYNYDGIVYLGKTTSPYSQPRPTRMMKEWFAHMRSTDARLEPLTDADLMKSIVDKHLPLRLMWAGGSESDVFNALEEIAYSALPRTPVLDCGLSDGVIAAFDVMEGKIISFDDENNYLWSSLKRSRVNWVVQSAAVDFLHIILTVTQHLCDEWGIRDARFMISIHDEIRYLVVDSERYTMALALHTANLISRSIISQLCGLSDLPASVAFFSSVDVDKCLRKEPHLDCVTPSNLRGVKETYGVPDGESVDFEMCARIALPIIEERMKKLHGENNG